MVTEITDRDVMTLRELKKIYATKWIRYVIVGDLNFKSPSDNMCYAVHTADSKEELHKHPYQDKSKYNGGIASGNRVVSQPEVGGVYVHT